MNDEKKIVQVLIVVWSDEKILTVEPSSSICFSPYSFCKSRMLSEGTLFPRTISSELFLTDPPIHTFLSCCFPHSKLVIALFQASGQTWKKKKKKSGTFFSIGVLGLHSKVSGELHELLSQPASRDPGVPFHRQDTTEPMSQADGTSGKAYLREQNVAQQ